MQLLSIGNSFSQDAHKWLHKLAEINGVDLETANLYIGSCPLKSHWHNYIDNNPEYDYEPNGEGCERKISISETLSLKKWDIVTLQQVSADSGMYDTYEPYLSSLVFEIKKIIPDVKIYFHQTWAYETDSTHGGFVNYHNNQHEMFRCIEDACEKAARSIDAEVIPSGKVIQTLRDNVPEFDYKNGGLSLCRDGFHLSLDYGRFAAAAIWLRTITDQKIQAERFEGFDSGILQKILDVVNSL